MILLRSIIDLLFPPLCICCGSQVDRSQLCETCWESSGVIDPTNRCIHCFQPSETALCFACSEYPLLPYPKAAVFEQEAPILQLIDDEASEALAAYAYFQWQQLGWPDPDVIVSVIPSPIAKGLAVLCNKSSPNYFRRKLRLEESETWELREGLIQEDAIILLFDPGCKGHELESACAAISEAFPKKVYILSLVLTNNSSWL